MLLDTMRTQEATPTPGASYEVYSSIVDAHNQSSRKNGIFSQEIYEAAMADHSTAKVVIDGATVPVLIDMKYGLGLDYDEVRTRHLTDCKTVSALALSIGDLDDEAREAVLDAIAARGEGAVYFRDNGALMVDEEHTQWQEHDTQIIRDGLKTRGVQFEEKRIIDTQAKPGFEEASMSFYELDFLYDGPESKTPRLREVLDHFNDVVRSQITDLDNAVLLREGSSFSEPELDEMWDLYVNRFQPLGEYHAVSMEDTKQDFLELFASESVVFSTKRQDGKLVCFTYFTEDFDKLIWLNPSFLTATKAPVDERMTVYFPGLVADRSAGGLNAFEVISLFAHEMKAVRGSIRAIFENTNFSEQYVPAIVYRTLAAQDDYTVSYPQKIDEIRYRFIELQGA